MMGFFLMGGADVVVDVLRALRPDGVVFRGVDGQAAVLPRAGGEGVSLHLRPWTGGR